MLKFKINDNLQTSFQRIHPLKIVSQIRDRIYRIFFFIISNIISLKSCKKYNFPGVNHIKSYLNDYLEKTAYNPGEIYFLKSFFITD